MGDLSQITSDQEHESIWKILAIEIDHQILALNIGYYHTIAFEERLSSFSIDFGMISLLARQL